MITAYLDESQQTQSSKHVVVAGFCGTEDQWRAFLPAWKEGLGRRKSLHMTSLRWNSPLAKKRIKPLLAKLAPLPYEYGLIPAVGSVRIADYHDLVQKEPLFQQRMKGYHLCLGIIFSLFMYRYPANEKIAVVCESQAQDRYWELTQELFRATRCVCGPQHPYFHTIRNVYKGQLPFTDPADFLAFAIGKGLDEPNSKKDAWCRPIHPRNYPVEAPWTFQMPREKAREVVQEIKSNIRHSRMAIWQKILTTVLH